MKYSLDSVVHPHAEQVDIVRRAEQQLARVQHTASRWRSALKSIGRLTQQLHSEVAGVYPASGTLAPNVSQLVAGGLPTVGLVDHSAAIMMEYVGEWIRALESNLTVELHALSANIKHRVVLEKEVQHYETKLTRVMATGNAEHIAGTQLKLDGARSSRDHIAQVVEAQLAAMPALMDARLTPLVSSFMRAETALYGDACRAMQYVCGVRGSSFAFGTAGGMPAPETQLPTELAELRRLVPELIKVGPRFTQVLPASAYTTSGNAAVWARSDASCDTAPPTANSSIAALPQGMPPAAAAQPPVAKTEPAYAFMAVADASKSVADPSVRVLTGSVDDMYADVPRLERPATLSPLAADAAVVSGGTDTISGRPHTRTVSQRAMAMLES
ncbi:MAG: hypothetical protein EOO41_03810, partial [Methanobacteriota archaeon]